MSFIVTSPCVGTKDKACTKVCPVACFYDAGELLVIDSDQCTDCGLCQPECPVQAIFHQNEVPLAEQHFIELAAQFLKSKTEIELERLRCAQY